MRILFIAYDNDSYISMFPLGLAYLASVCRDGGHEVHIYNQDVYHWPESHLVDYLNREKFDVVGVGIIAGYYQYRKLLKISEAISNSDNRPFYVIGGHGPSPEPAFFLTKTKADAVVIGEGEVVLVELLKALDEKRSLRSVNGVAFIENGKFCETPRENLIMDIDDIPFPAWDLFPIDHYALLREPNSRNSDRCMTVISGRGCSFRCNFCYRMDEGLRIRSSQSLLEEIKFLHKEYGITYIDFVDELLMTSTDRTIDLCVDFMKLDFKFNWACSGRLNYAKPEVLSLMKRAGCVFINYGIESLDDKALLAMNKALTRSQIIRGIDNTLVAGISPGLNIIFGNIHETEESLKMGVDFLLKYSDHAQMRTIRPVTPYPGSALYYHAIKQGLLKDCEDFYENKHVNSDLLAVNFTEHSDDDFHKMLFDANKVLIEEYLKQKLANTISTAKNLYFKRDISFRGFRQT